VQNASLYLAPDQRPSTARAACLSAAPRTGLPSDLLAQRFQQADMCADTLRDLSSEIGAVGPRRRHGRLKEREARARGKHNGKSLIAKEKQHLVLGQHLTRVFVCLLHLLDALLGQGTVNTSARPGSGQGKRRGVPASAGREAARRGRGGSGGRAGRCSSRESIAPHPATTDSLRNSSTCEARRAGSRYTFATLDVLG